MEQVRFSQAQITRLDTGAVTAQDLKREISAAVTLQMSDSSKPQDIDIAWYAADSSNEIENPLLRFIVKLFTNDAKIADKAQKLSSLHDVIYHKLCAVDENALNKSITIEVMIRGELSSIVLEQLDDNRVKVQVGESVDFVEDTDFAKIKKEFAVHTARQLKDSVDELSKPLHRLAWADANITGVNATISYEVNQEVKRDPDYADSIKINVSGSGRTTDTGTVIGRDGLFATTVVDGGFDEIFRDRSILLNKMPIFSAVITTAAMHAVESGILMHGITGDELQAFSVETTKLLLSADDITADPKEWPAFRGVVYFKIDGIPKKFDYCNGAEGVTVRVSNAVPDGGFTNSEGELLTATGSVEGRDVLSVSINILECISGKDDFDIVPISKENLRYRVGENTLDMAFGKPPKYAEEYDGPSPMADEKFNRDKTAIESLERTKIALVEKHIEVREIEKSGQPQPDVDLAQKQFRILRNKVIAQQKKVDDIVQLRNKVLGKLKQNLVQAQNALNEVTFPERKLAHNQNRIRILENTVSTQKKKVDEFIEQQKEASEILAQQKEIDQTLILRELMRRNEQFAQKSDQI